MRLLENNISRDEEIVGASLGTLYYYLSKAQWTFIFSCSTRSNSQGLGRACRGMSARGLRSRSGGLRDEPWYDSMLIVRRRSVESCSAMAWYGMVEDLCSVDVSESETRLGLGDKLPLLAARGSFLYHRFRDELRASDAPDCTLLFQVDMASRPQRRIQGRSQLR